MPEKETIDFSENYFKLNIASLTADSSAQWRTLHCHEALELIHVTDGAAQIRVGERLLCAEKGDLVLINGNVAHYVKNLRDAAITYMQIELPQEHEFLPIVQDLHFYRFLSDKNAVPYFVCRETDELGTLFFALRREVREKQAFYSRYIKSYISLLIAFLFRHGLLCTPDRETLEKTEKILPTVRFIDENYRHSLSLDTLAAETGCNKFELCRKFKAVTGRTVLDYINYVRLYHAKQLLRESDFAVVDIAAHCGFSCAPYFCKVFKQYNGCTPGIYKKQSL